MQLAEEKAPAVRGGQGLKDNNSRTKVNSESVRPRKEFRTGCICCSNSPVKLEHAGLCDPCFHWNEAVRLGELSRQHLRAYLAAGASFR